MLRIFFSIILIINFTFIESKSFSQIQNSIIAKVENKIISTYDLKNKILTLLFLSDQKINQSNINSTKNTALRSLIDYKLKEEELSKLNAPIKNDENVNNYITKTASKYNTNISGLKKIFKQNNIDFEKYQKELQVEFAWQKLIFSIYGNKIILNDNEIESELNEFIKNQKNLAEFKLSEIEIKIDNSSQKENKINEIQKQIDEIGFENTAIKFSTASSSLDGGDIGWVSSKSLSPKFFEEIKKMKEGEVSNPIYQVNSIIFLKLIKKRDLKIDSINSKKIKENIISAKKNEYLNLFSNNHLSKLKNNALISIK